MNQEALNIIRSAFPAAPWVWPRFRDIFGVERNSPYVYSDQHGWSITVSHDTHGHWRGHFNQRRDGNGVVTTSRETLADCLAELKTQIGIERDMISLILDGRK